MHLNYIYMCMYMYVYMCAYVYVYMCVCMYTRLCISHSHRHTCADFWESLVGGAEENFLIWGLMSSGSVRVTL